MKARYFLAAAAVLALAGAGCGSSAPSAAPSAPSDTNHPSGMIPANIPGGSTPETTQLQPTGEQASDGIPSYPGAAVVSKNEQEKIIVNAFSSDDEPGVIQSWYSQKLLMDGYTAKESASTAGTISKAYENDQYRFVVNTIDQGSAHPRTLYSVTRTDLTKANQ
ncbi:MAG TPA: hypothetical protein VMU11_01380 [Verrucomicrobiae bacterium]|nr:hypothetical protein [Verrucomicrobiae bacterium]